MSDQACGKIEQHNPAIEAPAEFSQCALERVPGAEAVKSIPLETLHTAEAVLDCFKTIGRLIERLPQEYRDAFQPAHHWTDTSHPVYALINNRTLTS